MNTPLVVALNALRLADKLPPVEIVIGVLSASGVDLLWNGEAQTFEAPGERMAVTDTIATELREAAETIETTFLRKITEAGIDEAHDHLSDARSYRVAANFLTGVSA